MWFCRTGTYFSSYNYILVDCNAVPSLVNFNISKRVRIFTTEYEEMYNYTHSQPPSETEVWGHFHFAVALLQEREHHLHIGEETGWGKSWSGRLLE